MSTHSSSWRASSQRGPSLRSPGSSGHAVSLGVAIAVTFADTLGSRGSDRRGGDDPPNRQPDTSAGRRSARRPRPVERLDLPSDKPGLRGDAEQIELKNLGGEAVRQLEQAGAKASDVAAIEEEVADLI